nr:MAG TPA: hypothetical protein [Caudoviricetes sp.]
MLYNAIYYIIIEKNYYEKEDGRNVRINRTKEE